ncbi:DNA polymerase III subunit epsilon [Rhodoligotrophos defluvii]|uniref:DNA polymerase III subunit epsilon n=1 Tax=Rhodoligotrophos defluvii TaxID=2561934 RepID=UPI0010C982C4|nr:DNA polymerase III subunit epsilon [Rhodoligotrophos defluvii]
MRYIVLDTETTGLSHENGDRIIEIGGIEVLNHVATGRYFHEYLNPERDVHPDALRVHGITNEFLASKPVFAAVAQKFLEFIEGALLVIHNAAFDIGFLNAELRRLNYPPILEEQVIDTLALARRRHPMGQNSLDGLCRRYSIDNSKRTKHGALLDAELLAEVYVELIGGRQPHLTLVTAEEVTREVRVVQTVTLGPRPRPLAPRLSNEERLAHSAFVRELGSEAIWLSFLETMDSRTPQAVAEIEVVA